MVIMRGAFAGILERWLCICKKGQLVFASPLKRSAFTSALPAGLA
jgi:hypothetical protein